MSIKKSLDETIEKIIQSQSFSPITIPNKYLFILTENKSQEIIDLIQKKTNSKFYGTLYSQVMVNHLLEIGYVLKNNSNDFIIKSIEDEKLFVRRNKQKLRISTPQNTKIISNLENTNSTQQITQFLDQIKKNKNFHLIHKFIEILLYKQIPLYSK